MQNFIMSTQTRNYTIDAFRLLGAFSVILIHTTGTGDTAARTILQTMHWAVAFFFMASGYFFALQYSKAGLSAFGKTLLNLIGIFIVVNVAFALFNIAKGSLRSAFSVYTFISYGLSFHLWFINTLIGTYVAWWLLFRFGLKSLLIPIAILLYGYNLLTEAYPLLIKLKFALFAGNAVGFPLMTIGYNLAQNQHKLKLSAKLGIIIAIVGYLLQFAEIAAINNHYNVNILGYHLGVSTRIYALGIFIFAIAYAGEPGKLSEFGRKYSLPIYLYHPIVISILYNIGKMYFDVKAVWFVVVYPVASIVISFVLIYYIDKWLKPVFNAMNGSIGLQRLFGSNKQQAA